MKCRHVSGVNRDQIAISAKGELYGYIVLDKVYQGLEVPLPHGS